MLSAAVFRRSNEGTAVSALKTARMQLGWADGKPFHFSAMKHDQRLALLSEVAKLGFRTVSIISYKPDIPDPERFQANKWLLYRYLTRLLIERVSWLCRDSHRPDDGDGTVEMIFSDRAAMSYEDIRSYIKRLEQQANAGAGINIHWPAVDISKLRAVSHSKLAGLQIADAVATSYFYAVRLGRYGVADPSYMRMLKAQAYRHRKSVFGYGVKFLSPHQSLKDRMPHVGAAFEDW